MRLLVTAGPTIEDIDSVRFISNRSSGRMGYALASAGVERGWEVRLVSGPVSLAVPEGLKEFTAVRSAREMADAVFERFGSVDAVAMAAAVADYMPAQFHAGKIKKGKTLSLELVPTTDILAGLGERKKRQILVGFALEAGGPEDAEARREALRKAGEKRLDAVVLNGPGNIGYDSGRVMVLSPQDDTMMDLSGTKSELARGILDVVERLASEARRKGA